MSMILDEVYQMLVKELNDVPDENIFKYTIDEGFHEQTNDPIIRIVQLPSYPDQYADDTQISHVYDIQIDIFWAQKEPFFIGELIKMLMRMKSFKQTYEEPLYDEETRTFRSIRRYTGAFILEEEL